ncbi:MAG: hypothetical protein ACXABY_07365 [Candidatus Thorarchaeota archaeon]|jgi:hypothetical protein
MSQGIHLRKYGVQTTIDFELYEVDGVNLRTDWVPVAADCEVMKDEGASTQCTNTATDEGETYSIVLTATEMQAARLVLKVVDAVTKVFLDKIIIIETYGDASAMHAMDFDDAVRGGMTALPNANANAAGGLPISIAGGLDLDALNTNINDIETDTGTTLQAELDAIQAAVITNAAGADIAADIIAVKAETALIVADTNELQTDDVPGLIAALNDPTVAAIADGVWDELSTGHVDAGKAGQQLWTDVDAIKAVTDLLPDAGALTTIGTDTARLTAARAAVLTDWINGGRLDLLLDAIPTTAMRGTDSAATEAKQDIIDTVVDAVKVVTDNLAAAAGTMVTGTVSWDNTNATTTIFYCSDITEATADHYNGRVVIFTSGALQYQATDITDYALDTGEGKFTVTALTEAPADNVTFVIV